MTTALNNTNKEENKKEKFNTNTYSGRNIIENNNGLSQEQIYVVDNEGDRS